VKFSNHFKKFSSFLIISILLFNSSGYILLYVSSLQLVKKYVLNAIETKEFDNEIILLTISKSDIESGKVSFQWIHSKEFRYNGKMYDIKKNISDQDSLRFYCYYDDKENLLEELLFSFINSNSDKSKDRISSNISSFFLGLYFSENEKFLVSISSTYLPPLNNYIDYQYYCDVLTPPPQKL